MSILDGRSVVDKKYITFPDDLYDTVKQEQPNGVDLRIHKAFQVIGSASLSAEGKMSFADTRVRELEPKNGWFEFEPNQGHYAVDFREYISVPEDYCAILIPRSSMLRAGVYVSSALWDANFHGRTGGFLHVVNPITVQYGARLGQMIFIKADYNGGAGYGGRYQGGDSQVGLFTED